MVPKIQPANVAKKLKANSAIKQILIEAKQHVPSDITSATTSAIKAKFTSGGLSLQRTLKSFAEGAQYAKQKAIAALKSQNPYEHAVILDDTGNVILDRAVGKHGGSLNLNKVMFGNKNNNKLYHGHPSVTAWKNQAPPVSVTDLEVFLTGKVNQVFAFDQFGKSSSIKLTDNFDKTKLKEINRKFYTEVLETHKRPDLIKQAEKVESTGSQEELKILDEMLQKLQIEIPDFPQRMHKFWQKHAKGWGLHYKTDFEHLIK